MGHQERAKIVEICKVKPNNSATATAPKHLPLTFFDLLYLRSSPIQRVYFFNVSSPDIVPRLKLSLSLALCHFLPLAGNLVWPESSAIPFVCYLEGDGVSFSVAESCPDLDFKVLSGMDVAFENEAYYALVPDLASSDEKAAVVALQITIFPGEGFSLGVTLHHAVLDGRSVHMFIKSWAHICRSFESEGFSISLPDELTPLYDRTIVQDPRGFAEICARKWMSLDGPGNRSLMLTEHKPSPELVRMSFTLTGRDIEKIRLTTGPYISRSSTFSLVCAYAWVCMVKAEGIDSANAKARLAIPCDCRSRLDPPLPTTYFGNCTSGGIAVAGVNDLAADWREGLDSAVKSMVEEIKSFDGNGVLKGIDNWLHLEWDSSDPNSLGEKYCAVAGSPRFNVYATDFGWGRLAKIDLVSTESTKILLQDARDGDGIEFGLAMKNTKMEAFASIFRQGLHLTT